MQNNNETNTPPAWQYWTSEITLHGIECYLDETGYPDLTRMAEEYLDTVELSSEEEFAVFKQAYDFFEEKHPKHISD